MVNNTALFTRLDGPVTAMIKNRGYGHAFERGFTRVSEVVPEVGEHYRIVGYTFGGLNLIVRYITDAYDETLTSAGISPSSSAPVPRPAVANMAPTAKDPPAEDSLGELFSGMNLGKDDNPPPMIPLATPPASSSPSTERLSIKHAGRLVSQDHMIELKTTMDDCTSQCWFSGTRHIYIGKHEKGSGSFIDVIKQTKKDKTIAAWERRESKSLSYLIEILETVVRLGKLHQGRMRIMCSGKTLRIERWEAGETPQYPVLPLPSDLRAKWPKLK